MNQDKKKQIFAIFMLIVFGGSSIAYAFISIIPTNERNVNTQYVIYEPLLDSEEAYFLQKNIVVMKYFYTENCLSCKDTEDMIDQIVQYFNGKLFVEKIDMSKYANETADLDITKAPTIYLKGNTIDVVTENINYNQLITKICVLFFSYVNECAI